MPMRCDSCSGTGSTIDPRDRCATCNATRTQQVEAPLRVQIQPGMDNKHQIPFLGEGDVEPEVPEPGAVVIILQQQAHARFERVGNDLVVKRKISLADALCGFAFPLEHLDGRVLNLKLAPGKFAKPDMRMCVRGEGMPIFNQRQNSPTGAYGDLVVEFEVEFPERLSAEAQATLKKALPPVPAPPQDYDATEAEVAYVSRANIAEIRAQLARDAADDDDDDDASGGGGGIRCAHQ
jgi:DnaJ family protein A protein 2